MPLYEYACDSCNNNCERRHGFNETVNECPECGQRVRRVLHPTGVVFKGSGWYITDSRKTSDPENNGVKKMEEATSGKLEKTAEVKSENGNDSKPAETKTEAKSSETKTESKSSESKPAAPAA